MSSTPCSYCEGSGEIGRIGWSDNADVFNEPCDHCNQSGLCECYECREDAAEPEQPDLFAAPVDPGDPLPSRTELAGAKADFFRKLELGGPVVCPCCDRLASKDVRTIHSTMAAGLVVLSRLEGPVCRAVNVREIVRALRGRSTVNPAADFAKLRWWGLIESPAAASVPAGQKSHGWWTLTIRGRDFVAGVTTVPRKVVRWNKKTEGFAGERIGIREALGDAFNYDELLALRRELGKETR